jgi:fructose-bisphosphate aldolase class II
VKLRPDLLAKHQAYASEKLGGKVDRPLWVMFLAGT